MSELVSSDMDPAVSLTLFLEIDNGEDNICLRGRDAIATTNWQKVLCADLLYYNEVSFDPACSVTQRKAFSDGIVYGYELMIGLFSHPSYFSIDPTDLTGEDVGLFTEVLQGKFVLPEGFMKENGFEADDSSEYFFVLLAEKMSGDEQFSTLIESCEPLLREKIAYSGDLADYIVAGFFHGVASVYGLERLRYERNMHCIEYNVQQGIADLSRFLEGFQE